MKKITNIKGANQISKTSQKQLNGGFWGWGCTTESLICYVEGPGAPCGRDGVCVGMATCQENDCF